MQHRLKAPRRAAVPVFEGAAPMRFKAQTVILGLDPSLRGNRYGVIRLAKPVPQTLCHGTITCPAGWERSRCLAHIAQTLRQVLKQHPPEVCVVEGLFFAQNLQTALIMGEARGAALATLAEAGLQIFEMAPRRVKQAVVGYGGAQKMAVAKMINGCSASPNCRIPTRRMRWRSRWRMGKSKTVIRWFHRNAYDLLSARQTRRDPAHSGDDRRERDRI